MENATRFARLLLALTVGGAAAAQRTPDEALQALQNGNRRFADDKSVPQPLGEGVRRTLARGQSPYAVVLCCADSRVPPEHVFNAGLGELFVVRVAGHSADAETIASIEYAVEHLNVPLGVVLGHESCGAVAASIEALDGAAPARRHTPAIQQLLEHIEPAARKAQARSLGGKALCDLCEEEHAHNTVHETLRRSAVLRRFAAIGKFRLVAARYHLDSGEVEWLPNRPLPAEPSASAHVPTDAVPIGTPPHVALRLLQAGHRRFLSEARPAADLTATRREALTHGQQPLAVVLTCADSRVAPEHLFDAGLGELFVVRIAGNTLNDDALASIEYAVAHTGASLLVVMGHTKCGAVQAAAEHPPGQELSPNLRALLLRLEPAVEAARHGEKGRDLVDLAVRANAIRTVEEARSRSAMLQKLESEGRLAMLASVYDLATGNLHWLKDVAETNAATKAERTEPGTAAAPADPRGGHGVDHGQHRPATPAPAHGGHAHAPTPHGTTGSDHHGADAGHGPADHHAVPSGETNAGSQRAHGASARPAAHGDADAHESATHEEPKASGLLWKDPTVLVGITGVVSLLCAGMLAIKKR